MTSRKMTYRAKITKSGNTHYIMVPKYMMDAYGFRNGDLVEVRIEKVQEPDSVRTD